MALSFGLSLISLAITAGGASLNLPLAGATALDSRVTFTRASTATYTGSDGLLKTAAVDVPRLVYDPATLAAQGLLVEEQRTNSIINNTMVGAVVGTPGTLPTGWSVTSAAGLTTAVTGVGLESGISYVELRVSGTPSSTSDFNLSFQPSTQTAAASGQAWTFASYLAVKAGAFPVGSLVFIRVVERNSGGSYVTENNVSWKTATSNLATNRFSVTRPSMGVGTGFVSSNVYFGVASGVAVDITLRIGMPQLEQGAFATSVIPTTTAQATRAADVATMTGTNFSSWYNQTEGTFVAEFSVLSLSGFAWPLIATADTDANRIGMYKSGAFAAGFIASAGVAQMEIVASPIVANTPFKMAVSAQANSGNFSFNGGIGETDTSITMPTVNRLSIGVNRSGDVDFLNGTIKSITYYPRRLANTELQALTS